ncbi:uncharacterized protein LOC121387332 [Gigantopelta aegis]|uniref:uncharacterized protein LOC121387332 n=1 Tax=Gigantopelta aegis TaxID=1735272 RepID=UPI001B88BD87|nr:uncharacterized protein LOC121387332 [Gigantopelta aegis]
MLIAYAGWSVSSHLSRNWADRLVTHSPLKQLKVGNVYAVKGPDDDLYEAREIGNSKLITHLLKHAHSNGLIVVAAHSSGAFVADEFFGQLAQHDVYGQLTRRFVYYNLDGAGGLPSTATPWINKEYFVYVRSGNIYSRNANTMKRLSRGSDDLIELNGSHSGCQHYNCLHDVTIIHKPWDALTFDLVRDYGLFSAGNREVQYDYITQTYNELSAMTN